MGETDAPDGHFESLWSANGCRESRGWTLDEWLDRGIELDNAVMDDVPGVTFGFHLCRGNQKNRWLVEGGYEAIAEPIFRGIRAHRLLLEYDDARSGSFAPLAFAWKIGFRPITWCAGSTLFSISAGCEKSSRPITATRAAHRWIPN